jgi:hypothetical protein
MDYETVIRELVARSLVVLQTDPTAEDRWRLHLLPEWVTTLLPAITPEECVNFIRNHKEYSFAYYDAFGNVCGKPREIAAYVLTELIKELVEEQRG